MSKTIQPVTNHTINHGQPVGWKYDNNNSVGKVAEQCNHQNYIGTISSK